MNRLTFLKNLLIVSALPGTALARPATSPSEAARIRRELLDAWTMSEKMTLTTANQMPAASYAFRYTPEAMTFAEQWKHCCTFTTAQIAGHLLVEDPYKSRPFPPTMTKPEVIAELKQLYAFVRKTIESQPDDTLLATDEYVGDPIPNWRLLYALENHIIHHRGQCMVYLRLVGVTPQGYLGW